jgi:FlaA1/EpsC-like NDP-sugar epimerase
MRRSRIAVVVVPKMAALSLVEMADIIAPGSDTTETGLRSCEKIHEDLIHEDEPVVDCGNVFMVGEWHDVTTHSALGSRYTSDTAPRLNREAFLAMLDEAESYD